MLMLFQRNTDSQVEDSVISMIKMFLYALYARSNFIVSESHGIVRSHEYISINIDSYSNACKIIKYLLSILLIIVFHLEKQLRKFENVHLTCNSLGNRFCLFKQWKYRGCQKKDMCNLTKNKTVLKL